MAYLTLRAPPGEHRFENPFETLLKTDAKSDLKHVRSLINTRLEALETELGEIKSTRASKSITNRLTEQTGLLRTKIDELKNKLDRELNEASDDLKDEIKGNLTVVSFFGTFGSRTGFHAMAKVTKMSVILSYFNPYTKLYFHFRN